VRPRFPVYPPTLVPFKVLSSLNTPPKCARRRFSNWVNHPRPTKRRRDFKPHLELRSDSSRISRPKRHQQHGSHRRGSARIVRTTSREPGARGRRLYADGPSDNPGCRLGRSVDPAHGRSCWVEAWADWPSAKASRMRSALGPVVLGQRGPRPFSRFWAHRAGANTASVPQSARQLFPASLSRRDLSKGRGCS